MYPEIKEDEDEWRYISIVTKQAETFDLRFKNLLDSVDFIIIVQDAIKQLNGRNKNKLSPERIRGMFTFLLLRAKLEKMAKKRNTDLLGLFSRALYLTVVKRLPEDTFEQAWSKYAELQKLEGVCQKYKVALSPTDRSVFTCLRSQMQYLKKIDLTKAKDFKEVMNAFDSNLVQNQPPGSFQEQSASRQSIIELESAHRKVSSFSYKEFEKGSILSSSNSSRREDLLKLPDKTK